MISVTMRGQKVGVPVVAWYAPGEAARWLGVVAQAQGHLHFAGEHGSPLRATMEGALASGVRAAHEVHRALNPSADGTPAYRRK